MSTENNIDDLLFATSPSRNLVLNFLKMVNLQSAAKCLRSKKSSKEDLEKADVIFLHIIAGYMFEKKMIS